MLAANHWTEYEDPSGRVRKRTEGAEGVCNPIGRTISTNQIPQSFQGLNHQPKSTHGGTHGSSHICSRGWPSGSSMGGGARGPMKALLMPWCRGIENREVELAGLVEEHPHRAGGGRMG